MLETLAALGKIGAAVVTVGAMAQACTNGLNSGAERIDNYVNPPTCEHTVDGTTATTLLEDGTTFGITILPDGSRALTRELGECR